MGVIIAVLGLIVFFAFLSYLIGGFMQLLSNWTGKRINIHTSFGWTLFTPKKDQIKHKQDLNLFKSQMKEINLDLIRLEDSLKSKRANNSMLEIDVRKVNGETSLMLLPENPMIAQVDIAFKDICLYLKNYSDKHRLIDVKNDGNFNITVYPSPIKEFTPDTYPKDEPSNFVTLISNDMSFDEIKMLLKFAYNQMPQHFKESFLYNIDFDNLTIER